MCTLIKAYNIGRIKPNFDIATLNLSLYCGRYTCCNQYYIIPQFYTPQRPFVYILLVYFLVYNEIIVKSFRISLGYNNIKWVEMQSIILKTIFFLSVCVCVLCIAVTNLSIFRIKLLSFVFIAIVVSFKTFASKMHIFGWVCLFSLNFIVNAFIQQAKCKCIDLPHIVFVFLSQLSCYF